MYVEVITSYKHLVLEHKI